MAVNNAVDSKSSYSYLQYNNKVSGLVSGMDIDSLMEKLMKAESGQMEKLQQQKQQYEWKRDAYRDVNLKLSAFEKNSFSDFGLKSSWNAKEVSVSNNAVSAIATVEASGTISISEAKLATAGQKIGSLLNGATANSTMASLGMTDNGKFTINAINAEGGYTEKTIEYKTTDKISDVMTRINASGVGVTAIVSGNQLSLTANSEGKGEFGSINITSDKGGLFEKLGVLSGEIGTVATGSNGYIVANGVKIEGTSNKYTVSGYQMTINNEVKLGDASSKITSTTDTTKMVDKVKAFVTSYNDLIGEINKKTSEKKQITFAPLTDAQKAEMTKDEITKWEEKSKAGLLKGDSTLNKVVADMRNTLSTFGSNSSGSQDMLFKLGITTSSTWTDGGKLELNEEKLIAAVTKDPDALSRVFAGDTSTGSEGVIAKMRKAAQDAVATIKKTAGSTESASDTVYSLGKTITTLDDKIGDWKERLKSIEERYWNQFSAMESAISKANSQSSIFAAG